jgi:SSS family solute:Na+ symporter
MALDLVILIAYALGLVLIGWYSLRRARSREDYLVAGRRLGPVMYAATLSTVVLGGASTVGTVRLGYVYGLSGLWFCTLLGLGILVISLFLSRRLVTLNLVTVTELLQRRYNPAARLSGAVIMIAYALMVAVASIVACGTILHGLFGLPFWGGVLLGGGVVVLYAVIGGMWSITLTDIVQFFIMTIGMMFLLAPMSIQQAGGWEAIQHLLPASHFSLWALGWPMLLGFTLNYFLGIMIGQDIWQRVFTGKKRECGPLRRCRCCSLLRDIWHLRCVDRHGSQGAVTAAGGSEHRLCKRRPYGAADWNTRHRCRGGACRDDVNSQRNVDGSRNDIRRRRVTQDGRKADATCRSRQHSGDGVLALASSLALDDVFRPLTIAYDLLVGSMLVPIVGAIYWKRSTTTAAIASMVVSSGVTIFFLVKDGLDANSPIFYGLGSSLLVFCSVSMLREHRDVSGTIAGG